MGIVAILFGLVGAYGLRQYLYEEPVAAVQPPAPATIQVPLASNDLVAGKTLALGDVVLMPMTEADMQQRGWPLTATMLSPQQIVGRILRKSVAAGEPFLTSNLYAAGLGPNLADRLTPGYRAVTVPIHDSAAVGGFAAPGTLVDVVFRGSPPARSGEANLPEATFTLLEGVEVLALDNATTPGSRGTDGVSSVTLAVTREQANTLKAVEGRGELSLALRHPEERDLAGLASKVTLEELMGIQPEPEPFTAEIYRGASRQTVTFRRARVTEERFGGVQRADRIQPNAPVRSTVAPPQAIEDTQADAAAVEAAALRHGG
ncbi:MAG: Flp pilus assembly protein CpaB [Pirellulales bacterium]